MISNPIQEIGILTKILKQGLRLLLKKQCKKISNLKIEIISSSTQIIKGEIQRINIIAQNINYKDLLFDEFELEAIDLKINFKLINKKFYFKENPIIKFKISLSQDSIKTVLLSNNWNWIGNMISKEILNQDKLEDIKIKNGKFLMQVSKKNKAINEGDEIDIKTDNGKIYLKNMTYNKTIKLPIEDKIYIKKIYIENDLINISAISSISF